MRNKQIDVLKGIGAILVVIGHIVTGTIKNIIYAFHMPLFFFLSGYVFNTKKKFMEFVIANVKSLLIPFYIFNIISLLFNIDYINNNSFLNILDNIFYFNSSVAWNTSLWFFIVLFNTKILFYILNKLCKESTIKTFICTIITLFLGIIIIKYDIWLPFGLKIVPISLTFMYIGYMAKKIELLEKIKFNYKNVVICIFITAIFIISSIYNERVNMSTNLYGNYILYFLNALCGIYIMLVLSKPLENSKILSIYASLSMLMFSTQRILYKLYPFDISKHVTETIILTLAIYLVYYFIKSLLKRKNKEKLVLSK